MNSETKEFVINLLKSGVNKPTAIQVAWEPHKSQSTNFKKAHYGFSTISSNQLLDWCTKKLLIPEDVDALYVLYLKIKIKI